MWHASQWTLGAVLSFGLLLSSRAEARDVWSEPYAGVRHLHRVEPGIDAHVMVVDLERPEVSVVATRPQDRYITTSEFARRYDAQIAINANFYGRGSCGMAMGDGELFARAYEDGCGASIGFGRANEASAFDSLLSATGPAPADWMTEVLSGKPWLMRDGRPTTNWLRPQHIYRPNPRTVAGVTANRRALVLLTADGRRRGVDGLTGFQLVQMLQEFGVSDAINLDGGGSTTLVINGHIRNTLSDRSERTVMTHLGVRIRPGAVWWAAEFVRQERVRESRAGEMVSLVVDLRNTGRRPWRSVAEGGGSPRLVLSDGTVSYTASVERATRPGELGRFVIQWLSNSPGTRSLHARLFAPDGAELLNRELSFEVAVRSAPAREEPRSVVPVSRVATASIGCSAREGSPPMSPKGALGLMALWGAVLRGKKRLRP